MKVADLLSDLTQLQAADAEAALALVSARPRTVQVSDQTLSKDGDDDPDLRRAKDLLELHKTVKLVHRHAEPDRALKHARSDVARVMSELQRRA